jgi:hypothetical protein
MAKARIPAIAYLRTSSAANVGSDKDSDTRQRQAISGFAKRAGFVRVVIVEDVQPVCPASADPGGRHFVAGWPGRACPDRRRRRPDR